MKLLVTLLMLLMIQASKTHELNLNFQQNDYQLKFQRIELIRYNNDYIKDASIKTYKFNRTNPVVNLTFTFIVDVNDKLEGIVQAYKFMSNEYRSFPIRFGANVCKALDADVAGCKGFFKCGNFTGCPLKKEIKNHVCNWIPDGQKLPPYIPNGDYKLHTEVMYFSTEVFVVDMYGIVNRPISYN